MYHRINDVPKGEGIILRVETRWRNTYIRRRLEEIHLLNISSDNLTFHEIIEDKPQKFYMDVDEVIGDSAPVLNLITNQIKCWFFYLYQVKLKKEDIVITENVYPEKKSYHIVIDNYALTCTRETRMLFGKIKSTIGTRTDFKLDKLYKKNQNFRIEGSSKIDCHSYNRRLNDHLHSRTKDTETIHNADKRQPEHQQNTPNYAESLVGYVDHCTILPPVFEDEEVRTPNYNLDPNVNILEHIAAFFDRYEMDLSAFNPIETDKGIRLNRLTPSYCCLCDRVHESDNAELFITDEETIYHCWRRNFETLNEPRVKKSVDMTRTFTSRNSRIRF